MTSTVRHIFPLLDHQSVATTVYMLEQRHYKGGNFVTAYLNGKAHADDLFCWTRSKCVVAIFAQYISLLPHHIMSFVVHYSSIAVILTLAQHNMDRFRIKLLLVHLGGCALPHFGFRCEQRIRLIFNSGYLAWQQLMCFQLVFDYFQLRSYDVWTWEIYRICKLSL